MCSEPCNYGCTNYNGGFGCGCPQGSQAGAGGQCISTYGTGGIVCQQCNTDDVPQGGVPLAGSQSNQGRLGPIGAIDQSQSASLGTDSTFFSYDTGSSRYVPTQSAGGYNPYGGAQSGSYYGAGAGAYNQYQSQYSYRRRRRSTTMRHAKPIGLTLSRKIKVNTRVMQFSPVLKDLNKHMNIELERGNNTLFAVHQDKEGLTYLEIKNTLPKGIYNLLIRGKLKEVGDDVQRKSFNDRFGEFNFRTKVNVKVL